MKNKEIIDGLKMTMELITFDPSTGGTIDPDNLNDLNRTTYDACNGAIKALDGKDNVPDTNVGDTISRQAAIEAIMELVNFDTVEELRDHCKQRLCTYWSDGILDAIDAISVMPSAQPEIIRCKDCKYNGECSIQFVANADDKFFCGAGER